MPNRTAPIAQKSNVNNHKRELINQINPNTYVAGPLPINEPAKSVQSLLGLSVADDFHNLVLKMRYEFSGGGWVGYKIESKKKTYEHLQITVMV